jgi:multidrug efflux pump subunit AcrA (membrane-fusion protein)
MQPARSHLEPPEGAAKPGVDLSQLAVKRETPAKPTMKAHRRRLSRYVVPAIILIGFASLFGWAARDTFLPAQLVTVTPVIVTRAEIQPEGTPLFQAAGWIEPRPTATVVPALAPGVVEELFVVEGQAVEQGQPVAKLIDADARLALQQADAALRLADADVQNAEATLAAARIALANPNELQAALADAESTLAEIRLTLGNLPHMIKAARNRRQLAADNLARKQSAADAIAGRLIREAEGEVAAAESALAELESRGPTLVIQADALERKRAALAEQLQLMSEPKRAVAGAEATLAAAEARRDQAQLSVDLAKLTLERMTIRSPIAGRVLTVDARPGTRLSGADSQSQPDSSAVVSVYDPQQLQVRVDVRLEDVPQVQIGQPATIETAALSAPLTGVVSWVTTRADIQKNTLQVKVAIDNPPPVITPEMLGQVTFLAPPQPVAVTDAEQESLRLLIPRSLVISSEGAGAAVWLADVERGTARLQPVQLGKAGTDQLIEVTEGVDPTAKLIVAGRDSLAAGARIRITGEDQSLGQSNGASAAPAGSPSASVASAPGQSK